MEYYLIRIRYFGVVRTGLEIRTVDATLCLNPGVEVRGFILTLLFFRPLVHGSRNSSEGDTAEPWLVDKGEKRALFFFYRLILVFVLFFLLFLLG